MRSQLDSVMTWSRTDEGKKWVRYSMVSVISVVVSQVLLLIAFGLLHLSARWANILAVGLSAIPSYYLNRSWAWGKKSRSHFMKEVVPFWTMAFIGLVFSTWAADFAESWAQSHNTSHMVTTLIVMIASLGAFGVLWVAKFVILNKLMFGKHPEDLPGALDGRSGLPT
ncbi:MAG: GtrA family protein [Acidimicrobiales bacterium]